MCSVPAAGRGCAPSPPAAGHGAVRAAGAGPPLRLGSGGPAVVVGRQVRPVGGWLCADALQNGTTCANKAATSGPPGHEVERVWQSLLHHWVGPPSLGCLASSTVHRAEALLPQPRQRTWSPTSTKQRCWMRGSSGSTSALPWRSSSSFQASVSVGWGQAGQGVGHPVLVCRSLVWSLASQPHSHHGRKAIAAENKGATRPGGAAPPCPPATSQHRGPTCGQDLSQHRQLGQQVGGSLHQLRSLLLHRRPRAAQRCVGVAWSNQHISRPGSEHNTSTRGSLVTTPQAAAGPHAYATVHAAHLPSKPAARRLIGLPSTGASASGSARYSSGGTCREATGWRGLAAAQALAAQQRESGVGIGSTVAAATPPAN